MIKITPISERFPRIHFIIHDDKVALRAEQNTTDSRRYYKINFLFALPCQKKHFVLQNAELVWMVFQFFFNFHTQKIMKL